MNRSIIVTADDFGLTRRATDTLLEAVDTGALTQVSIIPNGYAVQYALAEWKKRANRLSLSIHINLTEGKPCASPSNVPNLIDRAGSFRSSASMLLLRTLCALPRERRALKREIALEMKAQIATVRRTVGEVEVSIDGHQHVHMVPMVFGVLMELNEQERFRNIRLPREPFFVTTEHLSAYFGGGMIRHIGLNILAWVHRRTAVRTGLPSTDYFIGTLLSGTQTLGAVRSALGEVERKGGTSVEIGFHPGKARTGELVGWKGDIMWHLSPWRDRERELLLDPSFNKLVLSFTDGIPGLTASRVLEVGRFIIAGLLAAITNLGLLYICTEFLALWYVLSAFVALVATILVSFFLQKSWTFSHTTTGKAYKEKVLFFANTIFGLLFNAVGLYVLVEYLHLWYIAAQFIILVLLSMWSFFTYRFVIFVRYKGAI